MLSLDLPTDLEHHFSEVVQRTYNGNIQEAIASLLQLHDRYAWKDQLQKDVKTIRTAVRRKGGISSKAIDEAIGKYRRTR